jgi:hypothetical protein
VLGTALGYCVTNQVGVKLDSPLGACSVTGWNTLFGTRQSAEFSNGLQRLAEMKNLNLVPN